MKGIFQDNGFLIAFCIFLLFFLRFVLHVIGRCNHYHQGQVAHRQPTITIIQPPASFRFWFVSFQNRQSEFLSIRAMSVFFNLLQDGSPESTPADSPQSDTGNNQTPE